MSINDMTNEMLWLSAGLQGKVNVLPAILLTPQLSIKVAKVGLMDSEKRY